VINTDDGNDENSAAYSRFFALRHDNELKAKKLEERWKNGVAQQRDNDHFLALSTPPKVQKTSDGGIYITQKPSLVTLNQYLRFHKQYAPEKGEYIWMAGKDWTMMVYKTENGFDILLPGEQEKRMKELGLKPKQMDLPENNEEPIDITRPPPAKIKLGALTLVSLPDGRSVTKVTLTGTDSEYEIINFLKNAKMLPNNNFFILVECGNYRKMICVRQGEIYNIQAAHPQGDGFNLPFVVGIAKSRNLQPVVLTSAPADPVATTQPASKDGFDILLPGEEPVDVIGSRAAPAAKVELETTTLVPLPDGRSVIKITLTGTDNEDAIINFLKEAKILPDDNFFILVECGNYRKMIGVQGGEILKIQPTHQEGKEFDLLRFVAAMARIKGLQPLVPHSATPDDPVVTAQPTNNVPPTQQQEPSPPRAAQEERVELPNTTAASQGPQVKESPLQNEEAWQNITMSAQIVILPKSKEKVVKLTLKGGPEKGLRDDLPNYLQSIAYLPREGFYLLVLDHTAHKVVAQHNGRIRNINVQRKTEELILTEVERNVTSLGNPTLRPLASIEALDD
jgi:hypothetical protein